MPSTRSRRSTWRWPLRQQATRPRGLARAGGADQVEDLALLVGERVVGAADAERLVADEDDGFARGAQLPVEPGELFGVGAIELAAGVEVVPVGVGEDLAVLPEVVQVERHEAPAADDAGVIARCHSPRRHRRRLVDLVHVVIAEDGEAGQRDAAPLRQQLLGARVGVAEVAELPDGVEVAVLRRSRRGRRRSARARRERGRDGGR